jgi:dienelactone hydrolase
VTQFRPWLEHLVAGGSAVIFPRYQLGGDDDGAARVDSFHRGLELGFAHLHAAGVPVVAAGYSYGGSLVFSYAANAQAWGLPAPSAVDSVFPAGPVTSSPLPPLRGKIRVLIQVGDRDTVAGSSGADAFRTWLEGRIQPPARLEVVRSVPSLAATHAAPKSGTAAARRAFWAPLDGLIAAARRTAPTHP